MQLNSQRGFFSQRVMAALCGRPQGLPVSNSPVRQPAHSCHPFRLATNRSSFLHLNSRTEPWTKTT
ncbi:hypothetical protein DMX03_01165 [Pseudomonas koreensis]|nr:hypothetical protein DMX03_01165 [Pseudomonas koreensis]